MPKFRKIPVVIEAHQWFKNGDHPLDNGAETEGNIVRYFRQPEPDYVGIKLCAECAAVYHDHGWIDTLEDGNRVCPGDWIITGIMGEMYLCKPHIFAETYEPVVEDIVDLRNVNDNHPSS